MCSVFPSPPPCLSAAERNTLIKLKTFTCLFRCSNVTDSRPRPHAPVQSWPAQLDAPRPPPPGRGAPGPARLSASLEGCPCSRAGFPVGGTRSHGTEQVPGRDHRTGRGRPGCGLGPSAHLDPTGFPGRDTVWASSCQPDSTQRRTQSVSRSLQGVVSPLLMCRLPSIPLGP